MRIYFFTIVFWVLLSSNTVLGQSVYVGEGEISTIRIHDDSTLSDDRDWIAVNGFANAGTCGSYQGQLVLRLRKSGQGSDRALSIAMMARGTNQTVVVSVDDSVADPFGFCYLRSIHLK